MSPPKRRHKDFPEYLRKRIKIDTDTGRESEACWHWTGKTKAARQRYRPNPATDGDGYREHAGRFTNEAATPLVLDPITGTEGDARRHVYGAATRVPVCDVPTLRRLCESPRCVSPWHNKPGILTSAQRKRAEGLQPAATAPTATVAEEWTDERCLALLRAVDGGQGVSPNVEKDDAADEAGIPRDRLTDEWWARYVLEEIEKEESANV